MGDGLTLARATFNPAAAKRCAKKKGSPFHKFTEGGFIQIKKIDLVCHLQRRTMSLNIQAFDYLGAEGSATVGSPHAIEENSEIMMYLKQLSNIPSTTDDIRSLSPLLSQVGSSETSPTKSPLSQSQLMTQYPHALFSESPRGATADDAIEVENHEGSMRTSLEVATSQITAQLSRHLLTRRSSLASPITSRAGSPDLLPTSEQPQRATEHHPSSDVPRDGVLVGRDPDGAGDVCPLPGSSNNSFHTSKSEPRRQSQDESNQTNMVEQRLVKTRTNSICVDVTDKDMFASMTRIPRRDVKISKAQQRLLDQENAWFQETRIGGNYANLPPDISDRLVAHHTRSAASTSPSNHARLNVNNETNQSKQKKPAPGIAEPSVIIAGDGGESLEYDNDAESEHSWSLSPASRKPSDHAAAQSVIKIHNEGNTSTLHSGRVIIDSGQSEHSWSPSPVSRKGGDHVTSQSVTELYNDSSTNEAPVVDDAAKDQEPATPTNPFRAPLDHQQSDKAKQLFTYGQANMPLNSSPALEDDMEIELPQSRVQADALDLQMECTASSLPSATGSPKSPPAKIAQSCQIEETPARRTNTKVKDPSPFSQTLVPGTFSDEGILPPLAQPMLIAHKEKRPRTNDVIVERQTKRQKVVQYNINALNFTQETFSPHSAQQVSFIDTSQEIHLDASSPGPLSALGKADQDRLTVSEDPSSPARQVDEYAGSLQPDTSQINTQEGTLGNRNVLIAANTKADHIQHQETSNTPHATQDSSHQSHIESQEIQENPGQPTIRDSPQDLAAKAQKPSVNQNSATVFDQFKATYPSYAGNFKTFLKVLVYLEWLHSVKRAPPQFCWDDFVRAFADYTRYIQVQKTNGGKCPVYIEYYNTQVQGPHFTKRIITSENLSEAISLDPELAELNRRRFQDPARTSAVGDSHRSPVTSSVPDGASTILPPDRLNSEKRSPTRKTDLTSRNTEQSGQAPTKKSPTPESVPRKRFFETESQLPRAPIAAASVPSESPGSSHQPVLRELPWNTSGRKTTFATVEVSTPTRNDNYSDIFAANASKGSVFGHIQGSSKSVMSKQIMTSSPILGDRPTKHDKYLARNATPTAHALEIAATVTSVKSNQPTTSRSHGSASQPASSTSDAAKVEDWLASQSHTPLQGRSAYTSPEKAKRSFLHIKKQVQNDIAAKGKEEAGVEDILKYYVPKRSRKSGKFARLSQPADADA